MVYTASLDDDLILRFFAGSGSNSGCASCTPSCYSFLRALRTDVQYTCFIAMEFLKVVQISF